MESKVSNTIASKLIMIGAPFVTVFLVTGTVSDPVNAPKLTVAGGLAGGLFVLTVLERKYLWRNFRASVLLLITFVLAGIWGVSQSLAPFVQNFYGTQGRNTGLLTYIIFGISFLGALLVKEKSYFDRILVGLIIAGLVNVAYCAWVLVFGDFISWNNPYKNILGLFGNPNFISAFLGMFITVVISYVLLGKVSKIWKLFGALVSILALYEIVKSHAIQGLVVTAGGIAIIGFYLVRSKFKAGIFSLTYALFAVVIGGFAIAGTLQTGPLSFVYKKSVSLRGSYWNAGLEMGWARPFTGIGFDTYGDWYRRMRPDVALVDTPSIHTLTNAAHNVVIDIFAYGGFPLALSYIGILTLGAASIFRMSRKEKMFDPILVSLSSVWMCYQVQSLISINQVGLAIWGWILTGLLLSYEKFKFSLPVQSDTRKKNILKIKPSNPFSPQLIASLGVLVGLFVASPPMVADSKYFLALRTRDAIKVEEALRPTLISPSDSFRYAQVVETFHASELDQLAYKYAKIGTTFNPDFFESWRQLYQLGISSPEEKALAMENMKRLDPRNPDVVNN